MPIRTLAGFVAAVGAILIAVAAYGIVVVDRNRKASRSVRRPSSRFSGSRTPSRTPRARRALPALLARADVLITPSAIGEAPTAETTGHPAFDRIWTLLHVPSLHLSSGKGPHGLPVGVQIVGPAGRDAALLAAAAWIEARL